MRITQPNVASRPIIDFVLYQILCDSLVAKIRITRTVFYFLLQYHANMSSYSYTIIQIKINVTEMAKGNMIFDCSVYIVISSVQSAFVTWLLQQVQIALN